MQLEVFFGDIAAADYRHLVVDRKRLVMHAAVGALEVLQEIDCMNAAARHRVEKANLDIRMVVEQ